MTTSTVVEHTEANDTLTITTTLELPRSASFPMPIPPLGQDVNTADAVRNLYAQ